MHIYIMKKALETMPEFLRNKPYAYEVFGLYSLSQISKKNENGNNQSTIALFQTYYLALSISSKSLTSRNANVL